MGFLRQSGAAVGPIGLAGLMCLALVGLSGCGEDETLKKLSLQVRDVEAKVDDLRRQQDAQRTSTTHPADAATATTAAAAAAAGTLDRAGLPALLTDVNPRIRRGAALLISQFADPDLKAAVVAVAAQPPPPEMAATTILALSAYLDDPAALAALRGLLAEKDYKQLRERVEVLSEVKTPALAPVLLEREQALELANIKQIDWDLVAARRSLVTVMGQQGNPVVVPRMLELIRLQSLAAQQAASVLQQFRDDATIAPGLAAILQAARENPPAKMQNEYNSIYNCLMVARKIAGPEALTREMIAQLFHADNNYRSAAFYGLRDWPYEKRAELLLAEALKPDNEIEVPNMKGTPRWDLVLRLLNEANQPDTDRALVGALQSPNPAILGRALSYLRNRQSAAVATGIGGWLKTACADPAFLADDSAGQCLEWAAGAIQQANLRGSFTLVAPLFAVGDSADFKKATTEAQAAAKLKNLDTALRLAVQIFSESGTLTDCPALAAVYNRLPDGDLKKSLFNVCEQVRWPIHFSEDQKTITVDQAKLDEMLKAQQLIPKLKPENDQF